MYDASKSLVDVAMFRLQPLEGAILVKFEVDGEVTITYIYTSDRKATYTQLSNILWNYDKQFRFLGF